MSKFQHSSSNRVMTKIDEFRKFSESVPRFEKVFNLFRIFFLFALIRVETCSTEIEKKNDFFICLSEFRYRL